MKVVKLHRGLDIKLVGEAQHTVNQTVAPAGYAICPDDYAGLTPKLLVRVDDRVEAGEVLFFDKVRPNLVVTSPVSGRVSAIRRGERRKIVAVVIEPDAEQRYRRFKPADISTISRDELVNVLLQSGLWTLIMQRPYGRIADPNGVPRDIFVSGFDSAPLAPDMNFVLDGEFENLHKGIEVLKRLTCGEVCLGVKYGTQGVVNQLDNAVQVAFKGKHPAGNVGVQIHHIKPINKGEVVWTVDIQNLAIIGRLFNEGRVDMRKTVAVVGSEIVEPQYVRTMVGAPLLKILVAAGVKRQKSGDNLRIISGNVLTGERKTADDYLSARHNQVTVIREGDKQELFGWAMPRLDKFSVAHSYFSWLRPRHIYNVDTNLHGGVRALVVTGLMDKYLPMNILPSYLIKACLAGDIERMEGLGIYEVLPEDLALCEFVEPSKLEVQQIIADGISLMIKELC